MFKNWSNRDWFWLTAILLGIIILILTWRLNDNDSIVNIISMFASGASIILALVAIVQSTMYNDSTNELNARITEKISVMENNVELVKNSILYNANRVIDNAPIDQEIKEEIMHDLSSIVQEKAFVEHPIISGYAYERLIYNRLKNIYSKDYNVKYESGKFDLGADIILENQSKIIFIEIKVISRISKNGLLNASRRLKTAIDNTNYPEHKTVSGIIIVISDDKMRSTAEIDNQISLVKFTKREIIDISDDMIKNKMMI